MDYKYNFIIILINIGIYKYRNVLICLETKKKYCIRNDFDTKTVRKRNSFLIYTSYIACILYI